MGDSDGVLESINGRTGLLFLIAGGLFVVFAALHGVEAFMNESAPKDIFGPAGFAFAFLGMFGLYPRLVDRARWLTQVGAVFATIGLVASAITSIWHVGIWVAPAVTPAFFAALPAGMVLGQFLGYLPFGVASLRAGVHSRTVGLLLIAVPAVLAVMIVTVATGYATSGSAVVLGSVQALIHFAIGYTLRTDTIAKDRVTPTDTAA
ncbi:hypothetical protein [Natronomonas sp. EA1]|uniref:hypothetical protein n=1 Tax=Natronomonas sp. EA1 TaxID=3421655 RepID=UPI003EBD2B02